MSGIRSRLTYANVLSTLALFIALGGGAYAAAGGSFVGGDGTVRGCVTSGGTLKVVKQSKHCGRGTTALVLQSSGRTGASGATGLPGAVGPQGPAGPAGAQGVTGPAGLSSGSAAGFGDPPPQASTRFSVQDTTVTLEKAGGLLMIATASGSNTFCNTGPCVGRYGLYVDGEPVPGTLKQIGYPASSGAGYQNLAVSGVVNGLAAGTHTVDLRDISLSGSYGVYSIDYVNVAAVALG